MLRIGALTTIAVKVIMHALDGAILQQSLFVLIPVMGGMHVKSGGVKANTLCTVDPVKVYKLVLT